MNENEETRDDCLTLGEVIAILSATDTTRILKHGFDGAHSYRGFYEDLAFQPCASFVPVRVMLKEALAADGRTFDGYKGGRYRMTLDSRVWLATHGETGVPLTRARFDDMRADYVAAGPTGEIEGIPGEDIRDAAKRVIEVARAIGGPRVLVFNGHRLVVEPHSTAGDILEAYNSAMEAEHRAYMAPEKVAERARQAEAAEEKRRADFSALVAFVKTADEKALRESTEPWPRSEQELSAYIAALADRQHDYGTCVYAMSLSAVAAFNYIAHRLGTTGFQSSCADLDILRRTRHIKGGFQILDFENLLYPQYVNAEHFPSAADLMEEHRAELAKRAREKLAENATAHPDVIAHWRKLVEAGE